MFQNFLNKPYPHIPSKRSAWLNNFFIGCFVALFLLIFQPFNLSLWQTEYRTLKILGFGLVSFIMPTLYGTLILRLIPRNELEDNWKVWKEMVLILGILLSIALGNMIYSNWLGIADISFVGFINSSIVTLLIGVFPIGLAVFTKYNRYTQLNIAEVKIVNEQIFQHKHAQHLHVQAPENIKPIEEEEVLLLIAENEKDRLSIKALQLLYIESMDNYSSIVYTEKGLIKKWMLRSSLKRLESQIQAESIMRCHRSFVVNLLRVNKVEGNAAGYKLRFSESEFLIPVSRNFASNVIAFLKK